MKTSKKWIAMVLAFAMMLGSMIVPGGNAGKVAAASTNQAMALNDTFFGGTISEKGEADFYNFTIPSAGWVTITYQGWNIGDGYYAVYNYDQTTKYCQHEIYTSSDINPKTHSVTLALEAGTYIVKVWADGNHTGDYRLKGSYRTAGNNEKEPNNYFQSAMALGQGRLVTGFFSEDDRLDFYTFNLTAPATVDVVLTSRVKDMYFSVWNKDFLREQEKEVYYASEESPKTSTMQLNLEPGTYYIKCHPYSDYCGRYQIKWTFAPTLVTAISIVGNKTVEAGKTLQLSTSIMPMNASNKQVVWSSDNNSVATINAATGRVKANKTGYTTIRARAVDDGEVSASITLIVKPKKMSKPRVKSLGKRYARISWKGQDGASQYQIQYSKKSSFKGSKSFTVSGYYSQTEAKLKKKGNLYFRIRAISYVNGAKLKGSWSKARKVRIR